MGRFSVGTAALGGLYRSVSEADASDTIAAAFEAGIRYFDTAPQYGHGVAEVRLGRALRRYDRDSYVVSSKVGRLVVDSSGPAAGRFADAPNSRMVFAFDRDSILKSIDDSLDRLGLSELDIVYIHDPDDHADEAIDIAYPVLHGLRAARVIRAIGVGMNQSAIPTRFVENTEIDVVLLAGRYTLLDQSGLRDLIPAARRHGVPIVIGGVFNSGILAGADSPPMFDYEPATQAIIDRVARLRAVCRRYRVKLRTAALAFPLREPSVSTVLLGARNRSELLDCVSTDVQAVPDDLWQELRLEGLIEEYEG